MWLTWKKGFGVLFIGSFSLCSFAARSFYWMTVWEARGRCLLCVCGAFECGASVSSAASRAWPHAWHIVIWLIHNPTELRCMMCINGKYLMLRSFCLKYLRINLAPNMKRKLFCLTDMLFIIVYLMFSTNHLFLNLDWRLFVLNLSYPIV